MTRTALRGRPVYPAIVLTGVAIVLTTSACSSGIVEKDGVIAFVSPAESGLQELAEGTLTISEGGCLALETEEGEFLIAWPRDVEIRGDSSSMEVVALGRQYRIGEKVSLPGGGDPQGQETLDARAPGPCKSLDGVYIVNTLG